MKGIAYCLPEYLLLRFQGIRLLGELLFNIFFCDLFFSHENDCFTNYVDDTIPYANGNNPEKTLFKIQDFIQKLSP